MQIRKLVLELFSFLRATCRFAETSVSLLLVRLDVTTASRSEHVIESAQEDELLTGRVRFRRRFTRHVFIKWSEWIEPSDRHI
jgi:hypothetical protein